MMTQILEPMHLSTNSKGNRVEGFNAVELDITRMLSIFTINTQRVWSHCSEDVTPPDLN